MKRIVRRIACWSFIVLPVLPVAAQKDYAFHTRSKEAIKYFQRGLAFYDRRQYDESIIELDKAIKLDSNFIEAQMLLGDVCMDEGSFEKSVRHYLAAIRIDPDFFPQNFFNLAKSEMRLMRFDSAASHLDLFMAFKARSQDIREKAEKMLRTCRFAAYAVNHPVPYDPVNMGDSINSTDDEYLPALTADGKTLVYTRRRLMRQMGPRRDYNEDFYVSKLEAGGWRLSLNMGPPVNTAGNEGAHCLSPDGQYVYFTACNRDNYRGCDLYYSRRIGDRWLPPVNMGRVVNSDAWDSQPSITSDGQTLYFLSARPGGYGKQDIWKTTRGADGYWTEPVNLGPEINTAESEMSPFIHPDNHTLYFASEGHDGMGGTDLFLSRLDADGHWSTPVNLGYPINTPGDESSLFVNAAGDRAYFASNKLEDGKGGLDICSFELYPEARPVAVSYVKGVVTDKASGKPIEATVEVIDLKSRGAVAASASDRATGEYLVCLPAGKDYAFNAEAKGYLFYSDHFSCSDPRTMKDAYRVDIALSKPRTGEKVVLRNMFFDTNDFTLKPESYAELDRAVAFLQVNPGVTIEISGHTDNVGDNNSNQVLSENRARTVYEYLAGKGIPEARMRFKGYGETRPVASNDTEAGRAANRRTEMTVVSTQ